MKKIIKINLLIISIFSVCFLCSCKKTYVNEIVTKKIEYVENVTITDFEDALVIGVEKADKTVVGIESKGFINSSFGSGVIVKCVTDGSYYIYYVVSNYHVVSYKDSINSTNLIYLSEYDEEINASVITYDKTTDLAILKFVSPRLLSVASINDLSNLKKGRFVIAIGHPKELKTYYNSVTIGNISFINRKADDGGGVINSYIQHTAPINSGNSGGGLFDINGNLIGINTWKFADEEIEGMGFAIPIDIVKNKYPEYF